MGTQYAQAFLPLHCFARLGLYAGTFSASSLNSLAMKGRTVAVSTSVTLNFKHGGSYSKAKDVRMFTKLRLSTL